MTVKKTARRALATLSLLLLVFSVACVSASWLYSVSESFLATKDFSPQINWSQLPSSEEDSQKGTNHDVLIEAFINGDNGLNNPDSALNSAISGRIGQLFGFNRADEVGSMAGAFTDDNELANIFSEESQGLEFIIQFFNANGGQPRSVNDIEYYYIFTTDVVFSNDDYSSSIQRDPNIPYGQAVFPVYRTLVVKDSDGNWVRGAIASELGTAPSAKYPSLLGTLIADIPAFDQSKWEKIPDDTPMPGYSEDSPIWTYPGRLNTIETETATDIAYYSFAISNASKDGYYRILTNDENIDITLYAGTSIISPDANGLYSLSNGVTYSVRLSGATEMTFAIEGAQAATAVPVKESQYIEIPSGDTAYFEFAPSEALEYALTYSGNTTISVYSSDDFTAAPVAVGSDGKAVWTATASQKYYILVENTSGGSVSFSVKQSTTQ